MSQDSTNGRVTMAILGVKLDNLGDEVNALTARIDKVIERLDGMTERQNAECRRVDKLENTVKWVFAPLGAIGLALAIGWLSKVFGL